MCRTNDIVRKWGVVVALAAFAWSCESAPTEWRTNPTRVTDTACGAYTRMTSTNGDILQGELLAVASSVLYLQAGDYLYVVPRSKIQRTTTFFADTWTGTATLGMLGGAASSFSQGVVALVSLPVWLVAGSITATVTNAEGRENKRIPTEKRARFPQGLPSSVQKFADRLDASKVDRIELSELAGKCPPPEKQEE